LTVFFLESVWYIYWFITELGWTWHDR